MISFKGKRVGLVLSGGGAKGAYQAGMLRAMEEAGLEREDLILAGTSIGALNGLLYAVRGTEGILEMLRMCGELKEYVNLGEFAGQLYSDEALRNNRIPVTACAYSYGKRRPEYFLLNDYAPEEQRLLVAASASLPPYFPPVEFRGDRYCDGAVIPEEIRNQAEKAAGEEGQDVCGEPAPADKIPVRVLKDAACDIVVVSFLKPEDTVDQSLLPKNCLYLESRPSVPLEDQPGTGTLDFRPERVKQSEEMGYRETVSLLSGN